MKRILLFTITCFWVTTALYAQEGCTCIGALNYDPLATINNGSCIFHPLEYRTRVLTKIPSVPETSGLLFWKDRLFTMNDSGGEPELYAIDTSTGNILQTVRLKGLTKNDIVDWEELSQDQERLYIGDIGNNSGTRERLCIYVLQKKDIKKGDCQVPFQRIFFRYPDQHFFEKSTSHNFDCEAFFVWNDTIHLFTKNRANLFTNHYTIPALPSETTYDAVRVDSFEVKGMITSAALSPDKKEVVLLGYYDYFLVFTWFLWDFAPGKLFSGNKRLVFLPVASISGQTEGVAYRNNRQLYVSNEDNGSQNPAKLVSLDNTDISRMVKHYYEPEEELVKLEGRILKIRAKESSLLTIIASTGQEMIRAEHTLARDIDVSEWPLGLYKVSLSGTRQSSTTKITIE